MKAMILAAGLGTRLRPLTDDRPKALVTVAGRTLLEIALRRLQTFGVREVIVNTHHYPDMISNFLRENGNFGMSVQISREETLLDTGGGLKAAARFFLGDGSQQPFIIHNVDVISTIDLDLMMRYHMEQDALATLAVQHRATSRPLLFDERGRLCGRRLGSASAPAESKDEVVRPAKQMHELAFSGIHIVSPRIFSMMAEEGAFSIIPAYLHLAAMGENIVAFRADDYYWRDLGRAESIAQAAGDIKSGKYSFTSYRQD
jgi:NDP-sugar pyrophosphorylase family protein